MAGHRDHVGRLAFLDGSCVRVNSFISESGKCSVTRLLAPNLPGSDTTSEVELDSLKFSPAKSFNVQFPNAKHVRGAEISSSEIGHGTVVEFARNDRLKDLTPYQVWTITTSCRITGEPITPGHGSTIAPTTYICNEVHVSMKNANDIVEFEDIEFREFDETSAYSAVVCRVGKSITFRRCRFSNSKYGVYVKSLTPTNTKKHQVKVYFVDCLFENSSVQLLAVENGGQAHLLNCTFVTAPGFSCDGVNVSDGGNLTAYHCTFTKLERAIISIGKLSSVEIVNCSFNNVSDAFVQSESNITARGCRITHCRSAFSSTGPQRATSYVDRCVMLDCETGFTFSFGKHDCVITNCKLRCSEHCVLVGFDVVGYIDLVDVNSLNTAEGGFDCVVLSASKCTVTINNTPVPPKPLEIIRMQFREHIKDKELLLRHQRCYKRAGVHDIVCPHCRKVEPEKIKFKMCARCANICYCSRKCQVAAWRGHKVQCDQAFAKKK